MIIPAVSDAIPLVIEHLARGSIVALPTETVYGLAGDARNDAAVKAIYTAKGRPAANPLIAHVSNITMAGHYVAIDPLSRQLMESFWPGPLTLVLPLLPQCILSPLACAALPTLAIRCPRGIFADIVEHFGYPLVAPSANRSGRISPTNAQAVAQELGEKAPLILDGGNCSIGIESTILKIDGEKIIMLRPGGISRTAIELVMQRPVISHNDKTLSENDLEAPGQMPSHYAPDATVKLNVKQLDGGEMLLAFGPHRIRNHHKAQKIINLSMQGNLEEAAARLFDCLRALDLSANTTIAVEPIPSNGLGEAINDRLTRAAALRQEVDCTK